MNDRLWFFLGLTGVVISILAWGLRVLPREHMQILASVPTRKHEDGTWDAVNLTWYGFLQAVALSLSLSVAVVLALSLGVPGSFLATLVLVLLAVCLPAARWLAAWVEQKNGTFTVGGAVFLGTMLAPILGLCLDTLWDSSFTLPAISALAVTYPLGEGLGRLACISFGCCYGKRFSEFHPRTQRLFRHFASSPEGPLRKASYAGGLEGVPLFPVQAASAVFLSTVGLLGVGLCLAGYGRWAGALGLSLAFLWRIVSEFLRADERGQGSLSAYQVMSLVALPVVALIFWALPDRGTSLQISAGLQAISSPWVALSLVGLGAAVFCYLGVSRVTRAAVRFRVHWD